MSAILAVLDAVLNSLWQAAALAALVAVVSKFARGMNAATRHAIWWATLCAVLLLPVAPRIVSIRGSRVVSATVSAAPTTVRRATRSGQGGPFIVTMEPKNSARWPAAVFGIWFLILAWSLTQVGRSYFYVRGVKRRASVSNLPRPAIARRAD